MSVDCDRVCRLCLSSRGELLPIFGDSSSDNPDPPTLTSKIKECVSVQINENDELPTNVCRKCVDNVNNWHIFRGVCQKTQSKLQNLIKKDGSSQLEEVKIKSEPLSEGYDDGVVIDGSYPEQDQNGTASNKGQPEGPPILASLGLTPRSDKGVESDKEDEEEEEDEDEDAEAEAEAPAPNVPHIPSMPEVSITVMRRSGETVRPKQGIQQIAAKSCLVCGREYRYSHNARRHELSAHSFDRYENKVIKKPHPFSHLQPKLRPNPFNPKARLIPNAVNHKMKLIPPVNPVGTKILPHKIIPKPLPIKPLPANKQPNNLPYPLRIKALKDLQIKKNEPQILKTLLTTKPEVLVSEPEILNSGPGSPETLISEPEIASFQVETILSEPDAFDMQPGDDDDEMDGEGQKNEHNAYDTVDMESDNEIEIARQNDSTIQQNEDDRSEEEQNQDEKESEDNQQAESQEEAQDNQNHVDDELENDDDTAEGEPKDQDDTEEPDIDTEEHNLEENEDENEYDEEIPSADVSAEVMEDNVDENEEETEGDIDANFAGDESIEAEEKEQELDPNKQYVTKTQRDFITKYRDIIEQINTKRCLCCDKEYPRRKAVIQHMQKNGHKVPKHTCYNCIITFGHIGALLSHMRANVCTDLWKIIYNENGITDDMIVEERKTNKVQYKDIFNARSYACKLCPAKFQLKQFITKHVLDVHEDGQSQVPSACVHCRSRFKDRSILKKHIRSGECIIYISCDLCSEKYSNITDFNNHALAVHAGSFDPAADTQTKCVDGRPTDCPICHKKNATYQNLVKHLRVYHDEDKPHYCQNCDEKFEKAEDLNNHIYMVHSNKAMGIDSTDVDMSIVKEEAEEYHYSCTECNAIFETVDAWTDHQVAEHNQVAHHCDQCHKKFLRPSELAEHKNTHLRVKLYTCSACGDTCASPGQLAEHVARAHPSHPAPQAGGDFYCSLCERGFKSRQAHSNHMRIHSRPPLPASRPSTGFMPNIIGKPIKQFSQQAQLYKPQINAHLNVPAAPYSCDICGKGFMHKKNIWKHKKVLHADVVGERNDSEENTMHASTEEDDYNVDENGALTTPQFNSFNFSSYVSNVQHVSTPIAPIAAAPAPPQVFPCEICMKEFPHRSNLWKHKRAKHGVINPNTAAEFQGESAPSGGGGGGRASCTICKISFSDKKSYYRHRKNVHKSTSQVCKLCGKSLSSTLDLYEHLKAAHARELLGYSETQGGNKSQEVGQELEVEFEGAQDVADPGTEYQARYPCDTCGKQFVGLLALQNHQCVNQVQSSQNFTFDCEICHKKYHSISALKSHRGWHLRSPDGKAAANNSGLWMPQNKVTKKVSKHEVVLDPSQLARVTHASPVQVAKKRLPPEVEVTVVNPNKKMRSDDSLDTEPQPSHHSPLLEDRYCKICDKEFTKRAAYQRHMDEVHQPNSVFCPVCDKSFTRKSTLLVHMRKHYEGGESSAGGQEHLQSQAEEEEEEESEEEGSEGGGGPVAPPGEFTCGQCGDGVASPRDLIAHRVMHGTPSPHLCSVCKVYFSRGGDLATHMRLRHSEVEKTFFPCAMCDSFYTNKKSLQRHIENAH